MEWIKTPPQVDDEADATADYIIKRLIEAHSLSYFGIAPERFKQVMAQALRDREEGST